MFNIVFEPNIQGVNNSIECYVCDRSISQRAHVYQVPIYSSPDMHLQQSEAIQLENFLSVPQYTDIREKEDLSHIYEHVSSSKTNVQVKLTRPLRYFNNAPEINSGVVHTYVHMCAYWFWRFRCDFGKDLLYVYANLFSQQRKKFIFKGVILW